MTLIAHDRITVRGDAAELYVLWVAPGDDSAALIDRSDPLAMPYVVDMGEVRSFLELGLWTVTEGVMPASPLDHEISEAHRVKRDKAYEVVRLIVQDHVPAVFDKTSRARRISDAMDTFRLSRPTVTSYLRRYFRGGMTIGSLIPLYSNCGAPGKPRTVRVNAPKRGRPVAPGHPEGCNVTEETRRLFRLAVSASYGRKRTHNLASAYDFCVQRFLSEQVGDPETGDVRRRPLEEFRECGLPTREQFVYWAKKDNDFVDLAKRRQGARVWTMANKPKTGTATARVLGPGSKYEIDATVLDVYIRSRGDRNRLVGRPTLYVVIDVFSRMIVGVYVGLENPSWVAAMMALANAVQDKVAFCKQFKINIEPEDWPAQHICGILLGDGGELSSLGIEGVLGTFNMIVETAAPYRADWKGIVESRFKLLQTAFAPYVEGYVESDFRQRGARDYREDAVLDIDDVTRIIIDLVLFYNNHHELKGYPRHPGQVQDEVLSIPVDLWRWGIATRSGSPRRPDVERFKFALMPRAEATVTPEGMVFQGRYYSCARAMTQHWFTRARKGRFKVPISYDKRDVDRIYVHDRSALGFEVALLTDRSSECAGLSGWEAHGLSREYARMSAVHRDEETLRRASTNADITRVGKRARSRSLSSLPDVSPRSQIRDLRAARAQETAADRLREVATSRPAIPGEARRDEPPRVESPKVVPIRPDLPATDVSAPTMAEILASLTIKRG